MKRVLLVCVVLVFVVALVGVSISHAIPSWAKKYETSCSTCHYAYPRLNAFGKAFDNNGYRFPGDDEEYSKDKAVSLGAEAYKRVWPDAIWPSDIPGKSPMSLRLISRVNITPDEETEINFEFPHELEVLFGGTIGESLSFFGELEVEHESDLEYGFALLYRYRPLLNIRVGAIEPMPIHESTRLTAAHYNYGNFRAAPSGSGERWRFRDGQSGVEVWGAANGPNGRGGFKYNVGLVNGQGLYDVNSDKDLYVRATYKIGGMGEIGEEEETGEPGAQVSESYLDDSFRLGAYGYVGKSSYAKDGTSWDDDFRVFGVDWDLWFRRLNTFGIYLRQTDDDPKGTGTENNMGAWFVEADYVIFPWLIGVGRYEWTDTNLDDDSKDPETNLIPAAVFMVRPNVKVTLEGQIPLDDARKDNKKYVIGIDFGF